MRKCQDHHAGRGAQFFDIPKDKARGEVVATGKSRDKPGRAAKANPGKLAIDRAAIFKQTDTDHDGKLHHQRACRTARVEAPLRASERTFTLPSHYSPCF